MAKKMGGKYGNDRANVQLIMWHEVAPEDTGAERNNRQPGTRRVSADCAAGKGELAAGNTQLPACLGDFTLTRAHFSGAYGIARDDRLQPLFSSRGIQRFGTHRPIR